jgi:hypothetical protein
MVVLSRVLVLDFPASAQLKFPVDIVIKSTSQQAVSRRRRTLLGYEADVLTHGRRILEHLTASDAKVCDYACVYVLSVVSHSCFYCASKPEFAIPDDNIGCKLFAPSLLITRL